MRHLDVVHQIDRATSKTELIDVTADHQKLVSTRIDDDQFDSLIDGQLVA